MGWLAHAVMSSSWGRYVMVGLAVLAGVVAWGEVKERRGRDAERMRRAADTVRMMRRVQDAGASVDVTRNGVVERMRSGQF